MNYTLVPREEYTTDLRIANGNMTPKEREYRRAKRILSQCQKRYELACMNHGRLSHKGLAAQNTWLKATERYNTAHRKLNHERTEKSVATTLF